MAAGEDLLHALMQAGLRGDAAAHAALLRALLPILHRFFARRLQGRGHLVEDLVQEVLMAVHEKRMTYDPARPFNAWLFAVARYKMIDHLRRSHQETPLDALDDSLAAVDEADASDARLDLEGLLATLNPKQAQAIRATHLEGWSIAEAAARQNISVADVKVSVHRGLKSLTARILGQRR